MNASVLPHVHQDDLRNELERNVLDAVRVLVESMGCESFSLPVPGTVGEKKFLAFGTASAITGLLTHAPEGAAPEPGLQSRLNLQR